MTAAPESTRTDDRPVVLVVDDEPDLVELIQYALETSGFAVRTAADGVAGLALAEAEKPDLVVVDIMMPRMNGIALTEQIRERAALRLTPILMLTARTDESDEISGLDAGADDFLTKSINDVALFARVRSLLRMKLALDELRLRDNISLQFGALDAAGADDDNGAGGRILVVENEPFDRQLIENVLADKHHVICVASGEEAQAALTETFDLIIVSVDLGEADGLRVCSHLRSRDETRNVSLLMLIDEADDDKLAKGLDLGVNDYFYKPIDKNELLARARNQIRHHRYQERLRGN